MASDGLIRTIRMIRSGPAAVDGWAASRRMTAP